MQYLAYLTICIASLCTIPASAVRAQAIADTLTDRRIFSEGRLTYSIQIQNSRDTALTALFAKASYEVWIRGYQVRIDFVSPLRNILTLYNGTAKSGIVIKESGADRYITTLDPKQWQAYTAGRQATHYTYDKDTTIQSYVCKKVLASLPNGKQAQIYYNPALVPFEKDYDPLLKGLEGVAVRFSYGLEAYTIVFQLIKIENIPVPSTRFELPQANFKRLEFATE